VRRAGTTEQAGAGTPPYSACYCHWLLLKQKGNGVTAIGEQRTDGNVAAPDRNGQVCVQLPTNGQRHRCPERDVALGPPSTPGRLIIRSCVASSYYEYHCAAFLTP